MSLDGNGTYSPPAPQFPAIPNTIIYADDFNQIILDIATALSTAIFRDGQAAFTANQSMGGNKLTNLANGVNPQDATTVLQVFTDPVFVATTLQGFKISGSMFQALMTTINLVASGTLTLTGTTLLDASASGEVRLPGNTSVGTVSAAELAVLDGLTASTAELNVLDGITASTAELNLLDGVTVSTADLNSVVNRAPINSPALTGTPTAPTAAVGTNSTQIATMAALLAQAFSTALPNQVGQAAGATVITDGAGNASWTPAASQAEMEIGTQSGIRSMSPLRVAQAINYQVAGELAAVKANVMLNAFRLAVLGSLSVQQMVDGVVDEYEDQTGIDDPNSVGFIYDSVNDFYSSGSSYSAPGGSGDRTASITVASDLAITTGSLSNLVDATLTGQVYFTYNSNITGKYVSFDFGAGVTKSITEAKVYAYESTTRGYWKWQGSNNGSSWTDISASVQILNGQTTWTITDQTAYRYFRIVGVSGGIDAAGGVPNGWGEVEFKIGTSGAKFLPSEAFTALATPTSAYIVLWELDVDTITLNTDLEAWVSREAGVTFTTAYATSNTTLNATSHGFSNGDRVGVSSSTQNLPTGLTVGSVYYVVGAAANSFQLSLTAGGAAVTFSSNGGGTLTARRWSKASLTYEAANESVGRILAGTADLTTQTSGTTMRYAIAMPGGKSANFYAAGVQWR